MRVKRLLTSEWISCVLLLCWTAGLNGIGLGALDFFRHTEADRTLIAWEMSERGQFLVPHLLGSPILTKPPLYYWLVAAVISIAGNADECTARLVSYGASIVFVLLQFAVWRCAGFSRAWSMGAALLLSTTSSFMIQSSVAEIDMLFAFLTAASLYPLYFSLVSGKTSWTLAAFAALALAFLTKGPPAIFFFGATFATFTFYLFYLDTSSSEQGVRRGVIPRHLVKRVGAGVLLSAVIVAFWLIPLAKTVGWHTLQSALHVEVFERVVYPAERPRGPLFYFGSLFIGLLPWSIPALASLLGIRKIYAQGPLDLLAVPRGKSFFIFSAIVTITALLMLTLAEGKSSRYIFPVYAFSLNVVLLGLAALPRLTVAQYLFKVGLFLSLLGLICSIPMGLLAQLEGVGRSAIVQSAVAAFLVSFCLLSACRKKSIEGVFGSLLVLMLAVRFVQLKIYTPHRNATRSVVPIAQEIDKILPAGMPVYTVELFERWVNYYLKRVGRESIRISPDVLQSLQSSNARAVLLLSTNEELWRLEQLRFYDQSLKLLGHYRSAKDNFLLVEVAQSSLRYLEPKADFPTIPSVPFYSEREPRPE